MADVIAESNKLANEYFEAQNSEYKQMIADLKLGYDSFTPVYIDDEEILDFVMRKKETFLRK